MSENHVVLSHHNDGKEKYQSHEVYFKGLDIEHGYGEDFEVALEEYEENLKKEAARIRSILLAIKERDIEVLSVDYRGEPRAA